MMEPMDRKDMTKRMNGMIYGRENKRGTPIELGIELGVVSKEVGTKPKNKRDGPTNGMHVCISSFCANGCVFVLRL
jgi:hypothetical protein